MFSGEALDVFSNGWSVEMPTAIISLYTPDGFMVATDTRKLNYDGTPSSTVNQKLFPIVGTKMAYALWGAAIIAEDDENAKVVVDMVEELKESAERLHGECASDVIEYASLLCASLYEKIVLATQNTAVREFPNAPIKPGDLGSEIGSVFLFGYYKGKPAEISCGFFHNDRHMAPLRPKPEELSWLHVRGALGVTEPFSIPNSPKFSQFRTAATRKPWNKLSISDGREIAVQYIGACQSAEGLAADPRAFLIGGDPHIATIKPSVGFEWDKVYRP